jgi:thioredoxin reductase (NADPH)
LANPKIVPVWNTVVEEIGGANKTEWLCLRNINTSEQSQLEVGGVFVYVGFMPNSQIFGPEFPKDAQGFLLTDDKMETPVPGLYIAGDVRSQYVRQISNAVGDATTAAVAATRYIEEIDATGDPLEAEAVERLLVDA